MPPAHLALPTRDRRRGDGRTRTCRPRLRGAPRRPPWAVGLRSTEDSAASPPAGEHGRIADRRPRSTGASDRPRGRRSPRPPLPPSDRRAKSSLARRRQPRRRDRTHRSAERSTRREALFSPWRHSSTTRRDSREGAASRRAGRRSMRDPIEPRRDRAPSSDRRGGAPCPRLRPRRPRRRRCVGGGPSTPSRRRPSAWPRMRTDGGRRPRTGEPSADATRRDRHGGREVRRSATLPV